MSVASPRSITSYIYNSQKKSTWWIRLDTGEFIPYAWFNLFGDQGPGNPGETGLPGC